MRTFGMCEIDVSELGGARTWSPKLDEGNDESESVVAITAGRVVSVVVFRAARAGKTCQKGVWRRRMILNKKKFAKRCQRRRQCSTADGHKLGHAQQFKRGALAPNSQPRRLTWCDAQKGYRRSYTGTCRRSIRLSHTLLVYHRPTPAGRHLVHFQYYACSRSP